MLSDSARMLFLAEIDPIQIAIIVIAMLGSFVQWIWGLYKQGREEAERRQANPVTDEEKKLREQAWKRQVQQAPAKPVQRPSPAPTPPVNDAWSSVREIFEQVKKDIVAEAQAPARPQRPAPTPVPPFKRPNAVRAETPPPAPPVSLPAVETVAKIEMPPAQPPAKADGHAVLRGMLTDQSSIRQAVLMREILGPPKALQSSVDSAF